jgi:hypothetical protein
VAGTPGVRAIPFLAAAAALLLISRAPSVAPDGAEGEPIQLFNGKDLSGFYTWLPRFGREDPDRVFSIVDRIDGAPAIRVSGQHFGGLVTREEYANYHLVVEFRWGLATWGDRGDRARDSGVLVHCQGPDGSSAKDSKGPWMASVEAQVIEGGTGDIILVSGFDAAGVPIGSRITATAGKDRDGENVYDPKAEPRELEGGRINWYGRDPDWKDELGFRGKDDVESPVGRWTRLEVICDGDTVTNIVNGKVVNAGTRSSLTKGKILFQSELAEIYFRKIEIRPLKTRS